MTSLPHLMTSLHTKNPYVGVFGLRQITITCNMAKSPQSPHPPHPAAPPNPRNRPGSASPVECQKQPLMLGCFVCFSKDKTMRFYQFLGWDSQSQNKGVGGRGNTPLPPPPFKCSCPPPGDGAAALEGGGGRGVFLCCTKLCRAIVAQNYVGPVHRTL